MIPRVIHRIWLDDPMPDEFERYGESWRVLHPDWDVIDWRDSTDLPWMPPETRELFDAAQSWKPLDWKRFQSDILRLVLLNVHGGVYVDTDVEPLQPLDDLLDEPLGAFAAWSANTLQNGDRPITNALMGARPGHPFIVTCIERLPISARRHKKASLAKMIGPWHITRTYRRMRYLNGDDAPLRVYPSRMFYPQSNSERDRGQRPDLDGAYTWHHWANTRDNRRGGVG